MGGAWFSALLLVMDFIKENSRGQPDGFQESFLKRVSLQGGLAPKPEGRAISSFLSSPWEVLGKQDVVPGKAEHGNLSLSQTGLPMLCPEELEGISDILA